MPKAVNYQDHFETLYLRCEYLNKIEHFDEEAIVKYKPIVKTTAYIMFNKLKFMFEKVGFEIEDILQITNTYLLAYMGLYSFKHNKELFNKYVEKYQQRFNTKEMPPKKEIERTERNNLINFLRQRLQHCSTICERKGRNIGLQKMIHKAFAETIDSQKATDLMILQDSEKFGYRKVTFKELQTAKENMETTNSDVLLDKDGFKIVEIQLFDHNLPKEDYELMIDRFMSLGHAEPETIIMEVEEEKKLESYKTKFNDLDDLGRIKMIKRFISKKKGNKLYSEELKIARKTLKKLQTVV